MSIRNLYPDVEVPEIALHGTRDTGCSVPSPAWVTLRAIRAVPLPLW
jgi:hypothetical protein